MIVDKKNNIKESKYNFKGNFSDNRKKIIMPIKKNNNVFFNINVLFFIIKNINKNIKQLIK